MSGTSETYVIKKEDITSSDIALGNFSGYLAFIGETSAQYGGGPGKIIGGVFTVTSGVISGAFDSNLNPNKELDNLIGTSILGIASGWGGRKCKNKLM